MIFDALALVWCSLFLAFRDSVQGVFCFQTFPDFFNEESEMKLKPLQGKIVVKREEAEMKTPGGILLPDASREKPQRGKVIAVGEPKVTDDGKTIDPQVEPGDIVLFTRYGGNEVKAVGEDDLLIMSESDILAIIS